MKRSNLDAYSKRVTRSEIRYFDDHRDPVPRDKATWAVFREVDENGTLLFEVEGFID